MFPALMALAVARVDETERGSVVGTTSAFLDLSFGLAPAVLGVVAGASGLRRRRSRLSARRRRSCGAVLLFVRRRHRRRARRSRRRGRLPG